MLLKYISVGTGVPTSLLIVVDDDTAAKMSLKNQVVTSLSNTAHPPKVPRQFV